MAWLGGDRPLPDRIVNKTPSIMRKFKKGKSLAKAFVLFCDWQP